MRRAMITTKMKTRNKYQVPVDVQGGQVSARGRESRGGGRSREWSHPRKQSPHFEPPPWITKFLIFCRMEKQKVCISVLKHNLYILSDIPHGWSTFQRSDWIWVMFADWFFCNQYVRICATLLVIFFGVGCQELHVIPTMIRLCPFCLSLH